jgi:hypothetical protein
MTTTCERARARCDATPPPLRRERRRQANEKLGTLVAARACDERARVLLGLCVA